MRILHVLSSFLAANLAVASFAVTPPRVHKELADAIKSNQLSKRDTNPSLLYPERNFSVPIDHFHNQTQYEPHSSGNFNLRYWFDDTYYKPGGPVFILESGETDASSRRVYLQKGILYELSKATGGIGVVIEHRYYGTSFPVPDLSTENMRFCTTDQALADTAYFAQNIVFPGHEHEDLTSKSTPWIAYGGSYSGAFVAFLRTQYPGVFWGAISSSGVTEAIVDYWQYYEAIRLYGPSDCISTIQQLTKTVDTILLDHTGSSVVTSLKTAFGLQDLGDKDFANTISFGPGGWQGRNWDPAVNDPSFSEFCGNITASKPLYSQTPSQEQAIASALKTANAPASQATAMANFIGWNNISVVQPCAGQISECYDTYNASSYDDRSLSQFNTFSWPYQYCNQWGYFQTGSGVPANILPLISRTIDLEYTSMICKLAFNITAPPRVQEVNSRGGYEISYPRLAIIDGQTDPWRYACPHSPNALKSPENNALDGDGQPWGRQNTIEEPFWLIPDSVHHWDENGLFPNQTTATLPPSYINNVHAWEVTFVTAWVEEAKKAGYGGGGKGYGPPGGQGGGWGGWGGQGGQGGHGGQGGNGWGWSGWGWGGNAGGQGNGNGGGWQSGWQSGWRRE